ncbi:MAG: hypothetical protein GY757_34130 [bacterium]|nr:hypothetical protein [bacterium]
MNSEDKKEDTSWFEKEEEEKKEIIRNMMLNYLSLTNLITTTPIGNDKHEVPMNRTATLFENDPYSYLRDHIEMILPCEKCPKDVWDPVGAKCTLKDGEDACLDKKRIQIILDPVEKRWIVMWVLFRENTNILCPEENRKLSNCQLFNNNVNNCKNCGHYTNQPERAVVAMRFDEGMDAKMREGEPENVKAQVLSYSEESLKKEPILFPGEYFEIEKNPKENNIALEVIKVLKKYNLPNTPVTHNEVLKNELKKMSESAIFKEEESFNVFIEHFEDKGVKVAVQHKSINFQNKWPANVEDKPYQPTFPKLDDCMVFIFLPHFDVTTDPYNAFKFHEEEEIVLSPCS